MSARAWTPRYCASALLGPYGAHMLARFNHRLGAERRTPEAADKRDSAGENDHSATVAGMDTVELASGLTVLVERLFRCRMTASLVMLMSTLPVQAPSIRMCATQFPPMSTPALS